jgi:hypothetical protein
LLKDGTPAQKQTALDALAQESPESAESILAAFADQTVRESTVVNSTGALVDPRIADLAGVSLSRLLGVADQFEWNGSRDHRDANLDRIRALWAAGRGAAVASQPAVAVVTPERLEAIVPSLLSGEASRRESAWTDLAALGPGAWDPLNARMKASAGESLRRLQAATRFCANLVRRVRADGPLQLREQLDQPLNADALRRAVAVPFSTDPTWRLLRVGISRKAGLQGTWVDVQVEIDVRRQDPDTGLSSNYQGGGSSGSVGRSADFPPFVLNAWDERVTRWLERVHDQPADRDLHLSASWRKD